MISGEELLKLSVWQVKTNPSLLQHILDTSNTWDIEFKTLRHRIWHVAHNKPTVDLCPICQTKTVNWMTSASYYTATCGYKCSAALTKQNPEIAKKREATNMAKFGTKAPAQNKAVLDKATKTKIERYGTDGGEVWREKIKSAVQAKYGVDNPSKLESVNQKKRDAWAAKDDQQLSDINDKRVAVQLEKRNVTNPQHDPAVRHKTNLTMMSKYGGKSSLSDPKVLAKVLATNMSKYGFSRPNQSQPIKDKIKATIMERYGGRTGTSQRQLSDQVYQQLCDRDWLVDQHHIQQKAPTAIGIELGVKEATVFRHMARLGVERRQFPGSTGERAIGDWLSSIGIEYETNDRTLIKPKEIDIYIPSHKLAIEYCGLYWHSDAHPRMTAKYHKDKMDACNAQGIRLLTIFEDEWNDKPEIVKAKLKSILNISDRITVFARKTSVVAVSKKDKAVFFNTNHIQGDGPGSITYGLTQGGKLVACMTLIKQSNNQYTLNRYATSCNVPGGFSKLLKHFVTNHSPSCVVSFADLRWSEGKMYQSNGFTLDKILPPDYYWFVDGIREHKFNWRHAGKLGKLPFYNPDASETVNMHAHGNYKIYNCGLQRWIL